jgi:hypothetical protein
MAEKIATTRIVDLPENISIQMPPGAAFDFNQSTTSYDQTPNTNYTQMNVHPNPYGNQPQGQIMPLPQATQLGQAPQYRLPSRDIPVDTTQYSNDQCVQPNYIPPVKLTADYIREYEDMNEKPIQEYKQKKHRESLVDRVFTELQGPLFVAILFFIFQMPIVTRLMYSNLSFLSIYNSDGNMNFYGLFIKSIMFGLFYLGFSKFTNYIGEL